ncbi:MAG: 50S ribosomal protein L29 [Bacteroidetes bacterium]|nr:50S ribosomal protein L29 [Bacteroidota bacterium]
MKNEELKSMPNKELVDAYKEERKRYQKMKFQNTVSQIDQPHKLKATRKNIARLLTELNDRRITSETNAYLKKINEENN